MKGTFWTANAETLKHYGVLGMRWGKRKGRKTVSSISKSSPEHQTKEKLKKKKLHEMTNAELKTLNERLQLEKSYKELTAKKKSAGRKFVEDLLMSQGKQLLTSYMTKHGANLAEKILKSKVR